ncbi:unnamed protein product [Strongylus vulgaris]|uniref:Uncharacterized protein n=1 Tax=Strongylus vulgaris TaxID=40348 RepID=A0A3P7JWP6_STRVU|nr:unnamed protein product [Strongylus vulgaris]
MFKILLAKLPDEATCSVADEPDRDELLYRPGMIDPGTEDKYIKLARSFRMFAMMETRMLDTEKHSRVRLASTFFSAVSVFEVLKM